MNALSQILIDQIFEFEGGHFPLTEVKALITSCLANPSEIEDLCSWWETSQEFRNFGVNLTENSFEDVFDNGWDWNEETQLLEQIFLETLKTERAPYKEEDFL